MYIWNIQCAKDDLKGHIYSGVMRMYIDTGGGGRQERMYYVLSRTFVIGRVIGESISLAFSGGSEAD